VEMIQSGWVGRQNRRKLWSRKLKYRFIVFSRIFSSVSVSVTDSMRTTMYVLHGNTARSGWRLS